jgi:hypothetical protein
VEVKTYCVVDEELRKRKKKINLKKKLKKKK